MGRRTVTDSESSQALRRAWRIVTDELQTARTKSPTGNSQTLDDNTIDSIVRPVEKEEKVAAAAGGDECKLADTLTNTQHP